MSIKLGLQVPINVCDYGLHINHYGLLIISPYARIGKYFNVHQGCNIGVNKGDNDAPIIGDNVFFGPGVKIFGKITLADHIAVSAGSVVTHSCNTQDVTLGGVPATIINPNRGNPFSMKMDEK
jgi:serine O-acetyltransferase